MLGDLGAADLGEDVVLSDDPSVDLAQPGGGVLHDHRVQLHVRGGRDPAHTALQVQVDRGLLEVRLLGRVDEVAAPVRLVAQGRDQLVDRLLYAV